MTKPLSATMVACIDDARQGGGELVRFLDGYWAVPGFGNPRSVNDACYSDRTVHAIVTRGEADYSQWRADRPIAVTLRDAE